jgi:uncharacterized RmlC-like cupin family protein
MAGTWPSSAGPTVSNGSSFRWAPSSIYRPGTSATFASAVTIRPHGAAGLRLSVFGISRDAKYYVHSYARLLSELYVVEGLK